MLLNLLTLQPICTRGGVWLHSVSGVSHALYSCTKPFGRTKPGGYYDWYDNPEAIEKSTKVADKLAWRANGENKFLRMIHANMEIRAPRYWWSHFDTYKIGTAAQSESTMHSLSKQFMIWDTDCEIGTRKEAVNLFNTLLEEKADITVLKSNLPEGFLQSRVVSISYASLQTMWYQRHTQERLDWWKVFLNIFPQFPYHQWLYKDDNSMQNRFRV